MNNLNPIYTEKTECQDCYKCVRECPVKAIKIQSGAAAVIPELCVLCGHCVDVCPSKAKKTRDDTHKAKKLIESGKKVFVSLAPSFVSEFPEWKPAQLVAALKKLGVYGVSETALGAQQVSAHAYNQLSLQTAKVIISSACPVVVDFITRFFPEFTSSITNLLSPMLAHCKMLHKKYGSKIGIMFIGPCIAKKREADGHPYLIDCVLTFAELRDWLKEEEINPALIDPDPEEHKFVPSKAEEGALYPVDGGMVATLKANCAIHDSCFMSFSGLQNIKRALDGLKDAQIEGNIFIEALACEGGCINGPKSFHRCETALKRFSIVKYSRYPKKKIPRRPSIPILEYITNTSVEQKVFTEQEVVEALHSVGKYTNSDELNCGGCGYDSCREFAKALLSEKAERAMCVTYMRKLAHNKANGLLRTMPSGVVIVDEELKVIECNRNFTRLFGNDIEMIFEQNPGIQGAFLRKIVPFYEQFRHVLNENQDLISKDFHVNNRVLHGSIFTIEPHHVVGGVFADITAPAIQKEQIVNRAQDVIQKNLKMVQQIAYLLGENASESEAVLSSIIESFSNPDSKSDKNTGV